MFLTVHATAGVIIGQQTGNVWLAFLAGFISHFLLDIVPHGDQGLIKDKDNITDKELSLIRTLGIADGITMLFTLSVIYLAGIITAPVIVASAIIGTIIPDYINAFYIFFKLRWLKWYYNFHYQLHFALNGFTINLRQGLIIQTIFLSAFILFLF